MKKLVMLIWKSSSIEAINSKCNNLIGKILVTLHPHALVLCRPTSKKESERNEVLDKLGGMSITKKQDTSKSPRASSSKPKVPAPFTEEVPAPPGEEAPTALLESEAGLYLYDQATQLFMTQEKNVQVKVLEAGRYLCEFDYEVHSYTMDKSCSNER